VNEVVINLIPLFLLSTDLFEEVSMIDKGFGKEEEE
jgi:hypothetical protein